LYVNLIENDLIVKVGKFNYLNCFK